jgi:hypothetical protein
MKRILFISTVFFIIFSCSKEQDNQTRELNISLKSMESMGNIQEPLRVAFYPNPFQDLVAINISGSDSAQIIISNDKGDKKRASMTTSLATIDFSKEKAGAYYCEVLVNKTVFRTYLIKY